MFKKHSELKNYDQAVIAYPEIKKMKITSEMEFIIIACDGVWDCVEMQEFCDFISVKLKEGHQRKISSILGDLFNQIIAKNNKSILI